VTERTERRSPNDRARDIRVMLGLTQTELGEHIGTNQDGVSRRERGETEYGKGELRLLTDLTTNPAAALRYIVEGGEMPEIHSLLTQGEGSALPSTPPRWFEPDATRQALRILWDLAIDARPTGTVNASEMMEAVRRVEDALVADLSTQQGSVVRRAVRR
jgi:transcriptional regulator with XRE-family HTH domain